MMVNDDVAAHVISKRHDFREEGGREEAGVSTFALMGQGHDMVRMLAIKFHQGTDTLLGQMRLVSYLKKDGIVVHKFA